MPTVSVLEKHVWENLGEEMSEKKFEELCFDFGIELDEVTSEYEQVKREQGEKVAEESDASKERLYKIDIPANRYDLLCLEGLGMALRVFLGREKVKLSWPLQKPKPNYKLVVKKSARDVRRYGICGVLRNLKLNQAAYDRIIQLQETFHDNLCRGRTLVSIGTHDEKNVKWPLTYSGIPPDEIEFQALKEEKVMKGRDLFELYKKRHNEEGKKTVWPYCKLIMDSPVWPVFADAEGNVMSLPPVINSELTKCSVDTQNMVIDVTATDLTKAKLVLDHLCALWMGYSSDPDTCIHQVHVEYEGGETFITPQLSSTTFETSVEEINKGLGTSLAGEKVVELLTKMSLGSTCSEGGKLVVTAPCTRSDILHPCDIVEDVGIAVGYNNLTKRLPTSATVGRANRLNTMSDKVRELLAQLGYVEGISWILSSTKEQFTEMRIGEKLVPHVALENSKSTQFEICRVNLLPGVLQMLGNNKSAPIHDGLRIFEVGDVVLPVHPSEMPRDIRTASLGVRNERRACGAIATMDKDNIEYTHGVIDKILMAHGYQHLSEELVAKGVKMSDGKYYAYRLADASNTLGDTFIPERHIVAFAYHPKFKKVVNFAHFGIPRAEVCAAFGINVRVTVVTAFEMNLQLFMAP